MSFAKLTQFFHRYRSSGRVRIRTQSWDDITEEEAEQLRQSFREAFAEPMQMFDRLEHHLLSGGHTRSHSSAFVSDFRLVENFAQHAAKETPPGTDVRIHYPSRTVVITFPPTATEPNVTKSTVTFELIEDVGIIKVLDRLKSISGELRGNTQTRPKLAKSLGQNKVLPARRLRLGRYADEKGGAGR